MADIQFNYLQVWVQISGLSLEMHNQENAYRIGNSVGRCLELEADQLMQQRGVLRLKLEINIDDPLKEGFWWSGPSWEDKWAAIMYERLPELCFECGRLGHSSQRCGGELALSQVKLGYPRYGPWMTGPRPRAKAKSFQVGGGSRHLQPVRDPNKKSWTDLMR